jgi:hypothetical protein
MELSWVTSSVLLYVTDPLYVRVIVLRVPAAPTIIDTRKLYADCDR